MPRGISNSSASCIPIGERSIVMSVYVCLSICVCGWLAGELHLTPVNSFCYMGSYLSNTISVDIDIN